MSTLMTKQTNNNEERSFVNKISSIISSFGYITEKDRDYTISDHVNYLIKAAESSEPKIKSKIENHIVKLGKKAIPALVEALFVSSGQARGMVAMCLIRIGTPSIAPIAQASEANSDAHWICDYVIREIEGSQVKLETFALGQGLQAALVS